MSRASRRKPLLSDPGPPLSPLPPPAEALEGSWKFALPVILLFYVLLAGLHAYRVPSGATGYQNAPDEAAHLTYVRSIAQGKLPTRSSAAGDPFGYEWHQPPLYYALAAPLLPLGEKGMRTLSLLCGVVSLILIYRTARFLFPNHAEVAPLAAGIAAFIPTHIALTSTFNNDALLELCVSATLWQLFLAMRQGFSLWRAGWLGVLLGAACLTKVNALLLFPVVGFGLFLLWRNGEPLPSLLRGAAWSLAVCMTVCGWWYGRNLSLYGELLPVKAFGEAFAGTAQAKDMAASLGGWGNYWMLVSEWSFKSFWAVFGTAESARIGKPVFLPDQVYLLFLLLTGMMIVGLSILHFRAKKEFDQVQRYAIWVLFLMLGLTGLSFLLFLMRYFQTQGRYLYPAMLPIAILFALGWRAVLPEKYQRTGSGLLVGLLAALSGLLLRFVWLQG